MGEGQDYSIFSFTSLCKLDERLKRRKREYSLPHWISGRGKRDVSFGMWVRAMSICCILFPCGAFT